MDLPAKQWTTEYLSKLSGIQSWVTRLQESLPVDKLGRVTSLVMVDPIVDSCQQYTLEQLIDSPPEGSLIPIQYIEDVPTCLGTPIWERLEGESIDCYQIFSEYRDMRSQQKRPRSIYTLSNKLEVKLPELEVMRQIYHWGIRCQAYDAYQLLSREITREMRQQDIEDRHSDNAKTLFNMGVEYLTAHPEALNPKTAIQLIDTAAKMERMSVGMVDDSRRGGMTPTINIANNMGDNAGATANNTIITPDINQNRERLSALINIMNNIGVLGSEPSEQIVDVE